MLNPAILRRRRRSGGNPLAPHAVTNGGSPDIEIDFENGLYWLNGVQVEASDLLVSGDATGCTLDAQNFPSVSSNVAITFHGTWTYSDNSSPTEVVPLRWYQNFSNNIQWNLSTQTDRTGELTLTQNLAGVFDRAISGQSAYSPGTDLPFHISALHAADKVHAALSGALITGDDTPTGIWDGGSTNMVLNYNPPGTTSMNIKQIAIWFNTSFNDADLEESSAADFFSPVSDEYAYNAHVLGDSFVYQNTPSFPSDLQTAMASEWPGVHVSSDGYAATTLVNQADRYDATPPQWDRTLVVLDGALELSIGETAIRTSLSNMIANLSGHTRYLYVEPNPGTGGSTGADDAGWQAAMSWVRDEIGSTHFVYTCEAMFCAYADANDITDVGNGLWPRSLNPDLIHYNSAGQDIEVAAVLGKMIALGYLPGTVTLPGSPQNVTGGSGTLTWDAPADDGGSPILGYSVQVNSSGWQDVPAQGSPTGYSKQYIRSMTGLSSGDYRVAAINDVGTGSYVEQTVT